MGYAGNEHLLTVLGALVTMVAFFYDNLSLNPNEVCRYY